MKPADIILVKFPFSDLESSKKRPALVLKNTQISKQVGLATIAMITSRVDGLKIEGDYKIKKWESAGLLFPSLIRLSKTATIEIDLIDKVIGHLNQADLKGVKTSFIKYFKYWI